MIYAFEDYELDLQCYELHYAGKQVKLEPQVFNVLAYLIQHRERVVTKEELLEQLWPSRFVSEATLTSRLTAARRAIGDRGREQRLIQTIHGRGYRFIAPVEERVAGAPGQGVRPLLTGERWWEAELHRLTGESLLRRAIPAAPQAETCLHQALAIARRQQAKSWELRAAMCLGRLWQRQGKRAAAHALLADIYGWFTEGFDTPDLQEAKALLEGLA